MTDPTPESGRELDARLETLHEEMRLMDLPEPPCPMPGTPTERGAQLLQNENLTLFGEQMVVELVAMAVRADTEGDDAE